MKKLLLILMLAMSVVAIAKKNDVSSKRHGENAGIIIVETMSK